jgi:hypothetical protein
MDWTKLDAALAAAVSDEDAIETEYSVAIESARLPSPNEIAAIPALCAHPPTRLSFTAAVSLADIKRLSEQPWVRSVSLGQRLTPLRRGKSR